MTALENELEILLPKLGESILGATITRWLKKEGDFVKEDEAIVEVATDKVSSEIPSPGSGYLRKIYSEEESFIEVGGILAVLSQDKAKALEKNNWSSPAVKRIACEKNLTLSDIKGTGHEGRITKKDVEVFTAEPFLCQERKKVEREKMSTTRKAIAEHMLRSVQTIPHATLIQEIDVTELQEYIEENKKRFFEDHEAKLTITAFIAKALAEAALAFPLLNAEIERDEIVKKLYVNLGIAVHTSKGVMVPVIKEIHTLEIPQIARAISKYSRKAKEEKLLFEETVGGTLTMTNFGMSGMMIGIPIIRFPEVAIVGVGAMTKKVMPCEKGTIGIRTTLFMSLTFDHRVVDGIYGCEFLSRVKENLEKTEWSKKK